MKAASLLILACGFALFGCATNDRPPAWDGMHSPAAIRMCQSDPALGEASRFLLPGMDGYLLQRSDCWSDESGVARAACSRGEGAAYEDLSVLVSASASDWNDSLQSSWPEAGRMGPWTIRESGECDGWSAFVGDRIMITATSRRLLEECLSRVDDNQAAREGTGLPALMHEDERSRAIWVSRDLGDVSITAEWVRDATSVSARIEGDRRHLVALEFANELKAVITGKNEACLSVAIPVGVDQGALHPFVVMEGLLGKWPVQ
jgi:hypothetical protein